MDFNHLASTGAKFLTRKLPLQACFCSTKLHRDVQPLTVDGSASVLKVSKVTLLRQLLAHEILIKS